MGLRLEHLILGYLYIPKPIGLRKPLYHEDLSPDLLDPECVHCCPRLGNPSFWNSRLYLHLDWLVSE